MTESVQGEEQGRAGQRPARFLQLPSEQGRAAARAAPPRAGQGRAARFGAQNRAGQGRRPVIGAFFFSNLVPWISPPPLSAICHGE